MGSPVLMGGIFHGAGSSQEDTIIPRLRSQDCGFILLIMFSLLHHNLWAVKMQPGEGACGKKYWHLRGSLKVMSPVSCWLSGWMKLIEFSSVCQPCLFLSSSKWQWERGELEPPSGDTELVPVTEAEHRDSSSSWGTVRGTDSLHSSFGGSIAEATRGSLTKQSWMWPSQVMPGLRKALLLLTQVHIWKLQCLRGKQ